MQKRNTKKKLHPWAVWRPNWLSKSNLPQGDRPIKGVTRTNRAR